MKILVTGAAGFIGMHAVQALIHLGHEVIGIDSLNNYYSIELKIARLKQCGIIYDHQSNFQVTHSFRKDYRFEKLELQQRDAVLALFDREKFDYVIHLAAQAGVRYSLEDPFAYADSNLGGFLTILEGCRQNKVKHLVYASSSSVYGLNEQMPFSEKDSAEHPISLYAATKKANEMMAHSYSHLYKIPTTGLRFFTVYGPWGRPDMALFLFTESILNNKPIQLFNDGNMHRDFTYIDDLIRAVIGCTFSPAQPSTGWSGQFPESNSSSAPYRIYNIASSKKVKLTEYIEAIEDALDRKAIRINVVTQPGDVLTTYADTSSIHSLIGYEPKVNIREGVSRFVNWYLKYNNLVEVGLQQAV